MSDLMYLVPTIPHLRDVKLSVVYHECLESEDQPNGWRTMEKWKTDPDASRYHGLSPRSKYFINGVMIGEEVAMACETSKTPFPEKRVPRRGLDRVYPDDPDYARICMEQGLEHLLNGQHTSPPLPNGTHSSPISQKSATPFNVPLNGTNGHATYHQASAGKPTNGDLPNGINGSPN